MVPHIRQLKLIPESGTPISLDVRELPITSEKSLLLSSGGCMDNNSDESYLQLWSDSIRTNPALEPLKEVPEYLDKVVVTSTGATPLKNTLFGISSKEGVVYPLIVTAPCQIEGTAVDLFGNETTTLLAIVSREASPKDDKTFYLPNGCSIVLYLCFGSEKLNCFTSIHEASLTPHEMMEDLAYTSELSSIDLRKVIALNTFTFLGSSFTVNFAELSDTRLGSEVDLLMLDKGTTIEASSIDPKVKFLRDLLLRKKESLSQEEFQPTKVYEAGKKVQVTYSLRKRVGPKTIEIPLEELDLTSTKYLTNTLNHNIADKVTFTCLKTSSELSLQTSVNWE